MPVDPQQPQSGRYPRQQRDRRPSWRTGSGETSVSGEASVSGSEPYETPGTVGHKWRDRQREAGVGSDLPPLPPPHRASPPPNRGGGRALVFGAILLLVIAGLIIASVFRPGDSEDLATPPPTSVAVVDPTPTSAATIIETVVPTNEPATTVQSDFLVCIDPGHGGWDLGRERLDTSLFTPPWTFESELTLSMSYFLRDELEARGIGVVMTRETGGAVNWMNADVNGDGRIMTNTTQGKVDGQRDELQARINICNEADADIMISLHLNGYDDQSVSGYQVFYNSQRDFAAQNKDLAVYLYREMTVAFNDLGYDAVPRGYTDDLDLGADSTDYRSEQFLIMIGPEVRKPEYTIVPTSMPGVIVETLFITNTNDANIIMNPGNQRRLATAWADGIEHYRENLPNQATEESN